MDQAISMPILAIKNLHVHRGGQPVLDIPDLALHEGEVLALLGPNGSGKSTLMLSLACLVEASSGSITFKENELRTRTDQEHYRKRVGMVFQDPLLFDTTVKTNIASGLKLRGISKNEREQRVLDASRRFGIEHLLTRSACKLSGGEAQRTSLARAFVLNPEIIFLDEPFASLDPPTRENLLDDLARVLEDTQTSAIFSTHDQAEALRLADTLAVMHEGRIVQTGPVLDVINHPANEFVAAFVGMETALHGVVRKCRKRHTFPSSRRRHQRSQRVCGNGYPSGAQGPLLQGRAGLWFLSERLRHGPVHGRARPLRREAPHGFL